MGGGVIKGPPPSGPSAVCSNISYIVLCTVIAVIEHVPMEVGALNDSTAYG
jgi:hypothetical protein